MQIGLRTSLVALALFTGLSTSGAYGQAASPSCTLNRGTYTCDWQAFRARFAAVHTVAVASQPMERSTERQLHELVAALGKSAVSPEQPGDLMFRIVPATDTGVVLGPADQPLARLEVVVPGPNGGRGTLLWVETLVGQADRPWPAIVAALLNQFEARFRHGGR